MCNKFTKWPPCICIGAHPRTRVALPRQAWTPWPSQRANTCTQTAPLSNSHKECANVDALQSRLGVLGGWVGGWARGGRGGAAQRPKATLSRHQRGSNCSLRFSELGRFTENLRVCPEMRLTGQRRCAWAVFSTTGDNVALVACWQRVESVRPYS